MSIRSTLPLLALLNCLSQPGISAPAAEMEQTAASGQSTLELSAKFSECLQQIAMRASTAGINNNTIEQHLHPLQPLPRVIALDRQQPEFTRSFADYFDKRVTEQRVQKGRALYQQHRQLLQRVQQQHGVPGQYLLAFWGMETHYGGYIGKMPTLPALATLACDQRRSEFFTGQLIDALHIIDDAQLDADQLRGSWAGAFGQMQSMPSVYRRYALDGDGDGRVDVFNSTADAMATAGHFLAGIGWQKNERWGREVILPENFDYSLAGLDKQQPLSNWRALGLRQTDGKELAKADMDAALLVPSGHRGPAFLVYENFQVILRWNRSISYALSVGHLADRINGAGQLSRAPIPFAPLSGDDVRRLQARLNALGHDAGEVDGILGPGTQAAIARFQQTQGRIADGFPDESTLAFLIDKR